MPRPRRPLTRAALALGVCVAMLATACELEPEPEAVPPLQGGVESQDPAPGSQPDPVAEPPVAAETDPDPEPETGPPPAPTPEPDPDPEPAPAPEPAPDPEPVAGDHGDHGAGHGDQGSGGHGSGSGGGSTGGEGPEAPEALPPPQMEGMPVVDVAAIPTGSRGHSTIRVQNRDDGLGRVGHGDDGAFRNVCDFSHMNFDDPIVFPGQRNATHLHAFFGNTDIDHRSTAQSIETTGNSTCRGGIINRSAYWVPAIIDTRDGRPVAPSVLSVYYKSGWIHEPHEIQPHPTGLRMIAGDARSTDRQWNVWYACGEAGRTQPHIPAGCPRGEEVIMSISFPQCWNGRDLDSSDHRSHMAYPGDRGCPSSHPVPLPHITFNVLFPVRSGDDTGAWRLSSDMYDHERPGGYSGHADWWDGWMPEFRDEWTNHCTRQYVSCHSHLLGPGREMY